MNWNWSVLYGLAVLCSVAFVTWAEDRKHRGAIILTLAGQGYPPCNCITLRLNNSLNDILDLGWSCVSVSASQSLFDLIIFHEDNEYVETLDCSSNVKKINLHKHGLAAHTAAAILHGDTQSNEYHLIKSNLEVIFIEMPYLLAQFKIASGEIFQQYLTSYTHWTYTDPDILWGDVSQWLHPRELNAFDIITFGKNNDANRLFLRGQFSLHKNDPVLNAAWRGVPHMSQREVTKQVKALLRDMKAADLLEMKKDPRNAKKVKVLTMSIRRKHFISAEGPYSTHVFSSAYNFTVLVTGRIMSDKLTKPVIWKDGLLLRCVCKMVRECITTGDGNRDRDGHGDASRIANSTSSKKCVQNSKIRTQASLPSMRLQPLMVQKAGDCGMAWLPLDDRLCGIPPVGGQPLNEAVLREGKWYFNDEGVAPRNKRHSGSLFHFRVWEDMLASNFVTQTSRSDTSCFIIYLAMPISTMYIHPCDVKVVQNIPVLSYRDFRVMQLGQERSDKLLGEAA